jgi:hypothetical protein
LQYHATPVCAVQVEEFIETHVFPGYPPFPKLVCTSVECEQRPRYFALNQWGWSNGAFFFGDVSMVLRRPYGRQLTVLLPVDTGTYAGQCHFNDTEALANCSAWHNFSAGSFDHFDHIALANLRFWTPANVTSSDDDDVGGGGGGGFTPASLLAAQFKSMFSPLGALPVVHSDPTDLMTYMEVMAVGNVFFSDGISHIVLSFSGLFGTSLGQEVVEWASLRGIGVAWSPGESPGETPRHLQRGGNHAREGGDGAGVSTDKGSLDPYPWPTSQQLFLDPTVSFVKNATANRTAFNVILERVRAAGSGASASWLAKAWEDVYLTVGKAMHMHNLRPGLCADTDGCFGVDDDAHCLCAPLPSQCIAHGMCLPEHMHASNCCEPHRAKRHVSCKHTKTKC